jgi:hypothetical protein
MEVSFTSLQQVEREQRQAITPHLINTRPLCDLPPPFSSLEVETQTIHTPRLASPGNRFTKIEEDSGLQPLNLCTRLTNATECNDRFLKERLNSLPRATVAPLAGDQRDSTAMWHSQTRMSPSAIRSTQMAQEPREDREPLLQADAGLQPDARRHQPPIK